MQTFGFNRSRVQVFCLYLKETLKISFELAGLDNTALGGLISFGLLFTTFFSGFEKIFSIIINVVAIIWCRKVY